MLGGIHTWWSSVTHEGADALPSPGTVAGALSPWLRGPTCGSEWEHNAKSNGHEPRPLGSNSGWLVWVQVFGRFSFSAIELTVQALNKHVALWEMALCQSKQSVTFCFGHCLSNTWILLQSFLLQSDPWSTTVILDMSTTNHSSLTAFQYSFSFYSHKLPFRYTSDCRKPD